MRTDPVKRALELRETLINDGKVLVVDYSDTLQGKDTSKVIELMPNVATGDMVFRAKVNIKELDKIASEKYGAEFFDITKKTDLEIEDFVKKQEFDFPLWYKHNDGFSMQNICDYNPPFILQVAGCNFHDGSSTGGCWYCFVDDKSNNGIVEKGKVYLGTSDTIDSMLLARGRIKEEYAKIGKNLDIKVLRTSGGEPTIALDWVLNLWREVGKRGLDFVGQIDSNLSTGQVVDYFEKEGIYETGILEKLAEYPVKVLTALKGCDEASMQNNVQSEATMKQQLYSLKKFLRAGFDIYPQMYNPNPATLEDYLKRMDNEINHFSLKIHIGPLKMYGPNSERIKFEAQRLGRDPELMIKEKKTEWDNNYAASCAVLDAYLGNRYGIGYKSITRSDVKLKAK